MRGPFFGSRVECASVRFASRRGGETSIRPHRCAALGARMRSNRRFAVAAARTLRVRALSA
eukprot:10640383-Lingulodinium_polyedra.AAC.1